MISLAQQRLLLREHQETNSSNKKVLFKVYCASTLQQRLQIHVYTKV